MLGYGSAQIITTRFGESQEFIGNQRADYVRAAIKMVGVAIAVAPEASHRVAAAAFEFATKDVFASGHEQLSTLGLLVEHRLHKGGFQIEEFGDLLRALAFLLRAQYQFAIALLSAFSSTTS